MTLEEQLKGIDDPVRLASVLAAQLDNINNIPSLLAPVVGVPAVADSLQVLINKLAGNQNQGASLKSSVVTLTAAQVIALNATPIQLVAAVAGKIIQIVSVEFAYVKGSAAFTITSSKHLSLAYATSGQVIGQVPTTGLLDQSANTEADFLCGNFGGIGIRGKAVNITCDDASVSVGTGSTVLVTAYYNVIG